MSIATNGGQNAIKDKGNIVFVKSHWLRYKVPINTLVAAINDAAIPTLPCFNIAVTVKVFSLYDRLSLYCFEIRNNCIHSLSNMGTNIVPVTNIQLNPISATGAKWREETIINDD